MFLEGKLDFEIYAKAGFFSLITRKKFFFFISLETCFDLYCSQLFEKEKVTFKEKHTERDSLIVSFYAIQTSAYVA